MVGPCPPQADTEQWFGFKIQFIKTYSIRSNRYSHEDDRRGLHDEIVAWGSENLNHSWTWLGIGHHQPWRTYWIKSKDDAMLFKLRWSQFIREFCQSKQTG
jgi:hypothetical protein